MRMLFAAASAAMLAACGQTGDLYLPDSRQGTVVTRPAAETPAPAGSGDNSPTTLDSPPQPPSPAPEAAAPEGSKKDTRKTDQKPDKK